MDCSSYSCGETMTATASFKSWAQQTEEGYQLQLALALRLSSQAALATDPNFLDFESHEQRDGADSLSHRFWVNGCLSYFDRMLDGFYFIHGVDPYTWSLSTIRGDIGYLPSLESLKAIDPRADSSIKVVLIDRLRDTALKELQTKVISLSSTWIDTEDAVNKLASIVCNRMGGIACNEDEAFGKVWRECSDDLGRRIGSVVLPIGILPIGLCVHRSLLFKVLADSISLPCRIAKGCKYCTRNVASSCIVRVGNEREYWVDLFCKPGALSKLDSSLNCTSSILVSSPLSHPMFKPIQTDEDLRMLAKLYFLESQSLNIAFEDSSSGGVTDKDDIVIQIEENNPVHASNNNQMDVLSPLQQRVASNTVQYKDLNVINSKHPVIGSITPGLVAPSGYRDVHPFSDFSKTNQYVTSDQSFMEMNALAISKSSSKLHLEEDDLEISWSELKLKKKIGSGSFGTVHLANWRDSEVAVKILKEQDFNEEYFQEFLQEVAIMKRLRHPNIVLFMGAVTQPPNLSIVTEYLSRGSLHRVLHMPGAERILDLKLRLNMAYDVAKGMNYLHQLKPPIIHRDLKSLNLLVDGAFTVKVCDFGLSRTKCRTYLSSKTAAGTPEWMAPEVLRNEPSNEKSDVYSFGVILWEIVTLQQPWRHLNQPQVVVAVAFEGQKLVTPSNVNPFVAALIDACLANEPSERPSFSYIMETLDKLIKSI